MPGARPDPLVVGLDLRRRRCADVLVVEVAELVVRHDAIGDVGAEAEDLCANRASLPREAGGASSVLGHTMRCLIRTPRKLR